MKVATGYIIFVIISAVYTAIWSCLVFLQFKLKVTSYRSSKNNATAVRLRIGAAVAVVAVLEIISAIDHRGMFGILTSYGYTFLISQNIVILMYIFSIWIVGAIDSAYACLKLEHAPNWVQSLFTATVILGEFAIIPTSLAVHATGIAWMWAISTFYIAIVTLIWSLLTGYHLYRVYHGVVPLQGSDTNPAMRKGIARKGVFMVATLLISAVLAFGTSFVYVVQTEVYEDPDWSIFQPFELLTPIVKIIVLACVLYGIWQPISDKNIRTDSKISEISEIRV